MHFIALVCCIIILLFLLLRCWNKKDQFASRPTETQKQKFADDILANPVEFQSNMYAVKRKMPWIDAITYEDTRKLIRENNFNKDSILNILN